LQGKKKTGQENKQRLIENNMIKICGYLTIFAPKHHPAERTPFVWQPGNASPKSVTGGFPAY